MWRDGMQGKGGLSRSQQRITSIFRFTASVGGDAAEMLEALVDEESLVAGKRVHELGLPKGILLLGVIRGGEAFIPSGQTVIQPQDRIVLLSLREKMSKLEGIVSKKKE